jgi:hypothetical protein
MSAYLLLWDRDPNSWNNAERDHKRSLAGRPIEGDWSCGSRKNISVGSRVFLKRTGAEVRGIVASGFTTGPVIESAHWRERNKTARYVPIVFDVVLDPFDDELLPQAQLTGPALSSVHWDTQGGGMLIDDEGERALERVWAKHLAKLDRGSAVPPTLDSVSLKQRKRVWSRRLERDSGFSRMVRLKADGVCAACRRGVQWRSEQVLEAAHIRPVEANGPDHLSNALCLCPNHHALFDAGFWTADPSLRIEFSNRLNAKHRQSFARALTLGWIVSPKFFGFHRANIFEG